MLKDSGSFLHRRNMGGGKDYETTFTAVYLVHFFHLFEENINNCVDHKKKKIQYSGLQLRDWYCPMKLRANNNEKPFKSIGEGN